MRCGRRIRERPGNANAVLPLARQRSWCWTSVLPGHHIAQKRQEVGALDQKLIEWHRVYEIFQVPARQRGVWRTLQRARAFVELEWSALHASADIVCIQENEYGFNIE